MNSRDVALEYVVIESSTHPGKIHRCIPLEWKSLNTGMAHLDTGCLYFFFASGKTRRQVHNVVCTADWVQSFAGAIAGFVAAEIELVRLRSHAADVARTGGIQVVGAVEEES